MSCVLHDSGWVLCGGSISGNYNRKGLLITDNDWLGIVSREVIFKFINALGSGLDKVATGEPHILIYFQTQICAQLVLFDKLVGAVRLGNLIDFPVKVGDELNVTDGK